MSLEGYKHMQENFKRSSEKDTSEILKIFKRLTSNADKTNEVSACD